MRDRSGIAMIYTPVEIVIYKYISLNIRTQTRLFLHDIKITIRNLIKRLIYLYIIVDITSPL